MNQSGTPSSTTRRSMLARVAGLGALAAAGCSRTPGGTHADADLAGPRKPRQAGVTTPQQNAVLLLAYDLEPGLRGPDGVRALRRVLTRWARTLQEAHEEAHEVAYEAAHKEDRFTATLGIGPALPARLGRTAPDALRELPPFPGDRLDPARCGGDLVLQLCADDARATARAAAALARSAHGTLRPRWRQAGFLPPTAPGQTPRNLLGFKDGTAGPTPEECERWVWREDDTTFLVVRRIHLRVAEFARLRTDRQEEIIGRRRASGAPLGSTREHDDPDIFARTPQGRYVIPARSHVRAASPRLDGGAQMLRRGYSYDDGRGDQGLLFLAFMRDPALFVRVQQRMAAQDELSAFTEHRGSAVAYVLPGRDLGTLVL
ncbi:Dyp-type peroxidase [Streptomyces sp. TRM68416]|uniref:Dyp-type peroxidase n=1 Tax=Streptomyces sp. TRM68416 TaxID=2758412 RepID=UPI002948C41F|nr:Dyp-type peroxidase [Streptomyces sp. TRM68416]